MKIHILAFSLALLGANARTYKVGIRGRKTTEAVCGPCSTEECAWQSCAEPNIYLCTQAGTDSDATGGCNPGEQYWLENDRNCKACCNIDSCDDAPREENPPTKTSKSKSGYQHNT